MPSLVDRVKKAKRVFIIGNGGSYANAMHMQNDLLSCGKPAFTMDPATVTAFANDHGYAHIFSRWLNVVGEKGDMLIVLSGSGKSPNILKGIEVAEHIGMDVERVFGGKLNMQEAEEAQVGLGHDLLRALR